MPNIPVRPDRVHRDPGRSVEDGVRPIFRRGDGVPSKEDGPAVLLSAPVCDRWDMKEIFEGMNRFGPDSGFVEPFPVKRRFLVAPLQLPPETVQLEFSNSERFIVSTWDSKYLRLPLNYLLSIMQLIKKQQLNDTTIKSPIYGRGLSKSPSPRQFARPIPWALYSNHLKKFFPL